MAAATPRQHHPRAALPAGELSGLKFTVDVNGSSIPNVEGDTFLNTLGALPLWRSCAALWSFVHVVAWLLMLQDESAVPCSAKTWRVGHR